MYEIHMPCATDFLINLEEERRLILTTVSAVMSSDMNFAGFPEIRASLIRFFAQFQCESEIYSVAFWASS